MESAELANLNIGAARQFLGELPAEVRKRGAQLVADGAVKELRCEIPGLEFVADLEVETLHRTALRYDPDTQYWWEECSCPAGGGCEHAAAAMESLLAETENTRRAVAAKKPARKGAAPAPDGILLTQVEALLKRPLSRPEAGFVNRLEERFHQLKERPYLNGDDLIAFGFKINDTNTWEKLDLWPSTPKTPVEFWHYVALAAEDRGLAWPEFLRGMTQLDQARERLSAWRRKREIDRWKSLLNNLQLAPSDDDAAPDDLELRIRFNPGEAVVEYRRAGALDYTVVKSARFREFDERNSEQITGEAAQLWQPLVQRARQGQPVHLRYDDALTRRLLHRFLRNPALRPFLCARDGEPLRWETESLRWNLTPAEDDQDDYRLLLLQPDGTPAPPALMVLPGRPALYVTESNVWPSPPIEDRAVDPVIETRIPAPALETAAGIRFLQHHGIALPHRLESRVATVRLKPRISGELRAIAFGNETEYAVLDVLGGNADGSYQERWNGNHWAQIRPGPDAEDRPAPSDEPLATYERSGLIDLPRSLELAGFKWDFARQRWLLRVTSRFPDQFSTWMQSLPEGVELELRGELASFQNSLVAGRVRLEVAEAGMDWFDLKVVLDVTDTQLNADEIKLLLDARGKCVRLGGKGWRRLEFNLSAEEDAQFARLGLNPRELSSEPQRLHALQLSDSNARSLVGETAFSAIERRVAEIQARVTPPPPPTLHATLRPYQLEGFHFLCYLSTNRFGGILADDMGLGKTLQTLAWIAWLDAEYRAEAAANGTDGTTPVSLPFLVVCPKSVTDNWRAESARFVPHVQVKVWSGEKIKQLPPSPEGPTLHVINYNQLRSAGETLSKIEFHAVILDEGQYIKNPSSITAQLARNLRSRHRLILSGTPIENKLLDLWSLMSFAVPGALGGRSEFQRVFDQKGDPLARQRLSARVRPFLLRRTKAQVARDLPDRIEEELFCELEGEQKTLYRAELKRAQGMLLRVNSPATLNKHRFNFLTSLLRLRQICCDARLIKPNAKGESAKLEALMETLEPLVEEGQKVLVFSQFVEMLELLRTAITERGWSHFFLSGATEGRGDLVRNFQSHPGGAVFLISLKAGGFGLNLTAASYVILFDPWWNPAVEAQAIDRTHRIGQTQKVIAYRLLIKNSVEEKIRSLQRQKSQLADDVLGEESFSQALTLDDLRFLLSEE